MGTKLVRSNRDRKILGVCGGLAEYLHIDSALVRIIWAIAVCCFGSGLLLYFIAAFVMPQDIGQNDYNRYYNGYNSNYNNNYNNGYNNNYNNNNNYYSNSSNQNGEYYQSNTYPLKDNR